MHLLILVHDLNNNAVGRAYSMALLAEELDWTVTIAGPSSDGLWPPLDHTWFARRCVQVGRPVERDSKVLELASRVDLILAVKTWPSSFGAALKMRAEVGTPILLDVDDADYEALLGGWSSLIKTAGYAIRMLQRGDPPLEARRLRKRVTEVIRTVSNPVLKQIYGGTLVPHARTERPFGTLRDGPVRRIGFVGTARTHKGVDVVRDVVARLVNGDREIELVITAHPSGADARPWERWIGPVGIETGLEIVADSDVVIIPLSREGYGRAQLPAKLIDAMMAGRPLVVSDLPVLRWAVGDGGLIVPPNHVPAIVDAIRILDSPEERERLGRLGRRRALERFAPSRVAPALEQAVTTALD